MANEMPKNISIDAYTIGSPSGQLNPGMVPGDYNGDGSVDAADYVVWRKSNINGQQGYNDCAPTSAAQAAVPAAGAAWPNRTCPERSCGKRHRRRPGGRRKPKCQSTRRIFPRHIERCKWLDNCTCSPRMAVVPPERRMSRCLSVKCRSKARTRELCHQRSERRGRAGAGLGSVSGRCLRRGVSPTPSAP